MVKNKVLARALTILTALLASALVMLGWQLFLRLSQELRESIEIPVRVLIAVITVAIGVFIWRGGWEDTDR